MAAPLEDTSAAAARASGAALRGSFAAAAAAPAASAAPSASHSAEALRGPAATKADALRELIAAKVALEEASSRAAVAELALSAARSALAAERARSAASVEAVRRETSDAVQSLWAELAQATAERDAALAAPGAPGASPVFARLRGDPAALAACSVDELQRLSATNNAAGAAIRDALMNALVAEQVRGAAGGGSSPGSGGRDGTCPVCEDEAHPRDTRLAPCGHVFCGACAANVKECPMCRKPVKRRERVFL